jgi:hypothetical protein
MPLTMDQLTPLTEASPMLDKMQQALSNAGHKATAYALLKLQQDAGIELEKAFGIYDPKAGPETAALDKAYKEATPARLIKVLHTVSDSLPESELKSSLSELRQKMVPHVPQAGVKPYAFTR